jgi:hypothetical protein
MVGLFARFIAPPGVADHDLYRSWPRLEIVRDWPAAEVQLHRWAAAHVRDGVEGEPLKIAHDAPRRLAFMLAARERPVRLADLPGYEGEGNRSARSHAQSALLSAMADARVSDLLRRPMPGAAKRNYAWALEPSLSDFHALLAAARTKDEEAAHILSFGGHGQLVGGWKDSFRSPSALAQVARPGLVNTALEEHEVREVVEIILSRRRVRPMPRSDRTSVATDQEVVEEAVAAPPQAFDHQLDADEAGEPGYGGGGGHSPRLRRRVLLALLAIAFAVAAATVIRRPAPEPEQVSAPRTVIIKGAGAEGVVVRSGPSSGAGAVDDLAEGERVRVQCQTLGQPYAFAGRSSAIWNRVGREAYFTNLFAATPHPERFTPGIPRCPPAE